MAENPNQLARTNQIDRQTAGAIQVSTKSGMLIENVNQAMEVAKLMSISGSAVPSHIRNNAGTCLAVAIQAWEWSMNPFAVANKSYVVNDRLAYESALYNAVATRRAPIKGRLKIAYAGEGANRRCTVSAKLNADAGGGDVEYQSPPFGQINPKNSPMWKNDPDQQLFYFSVRAFVRRHFPDVMMGVYTVDELQDSPDAPPRAEKPRREVASIDVTATLGRAVEETTRPGGTPETAPQPKPSEEPAPEPFADDAPPAEPEPAPAAEEPSIVDRIRAAWATKLAEAHGFDPHPDLVDEQIDNFCLNRWAKMSFADVQAKQPKWLEKLLGFIVNGKIPPERFNFNVQAAPDAELPEETTRPGK